MDYEALAREWIDGIGWSDPDLPHDAWFKANPEVVSSLTALLRKVVEDERKACADEAYFKCRCGEPGWHDEECRARNQVYDAIKARATPGKGAGAP